MGTMVVIFSVCVTSQCDVKRYDDGSVATYELCYV